MYFKMDEVEELVSSEDRSELVSSLISLSESICQKANELKDSENPEGKYHSFFGNHVAQTNCLLYTRNCETRQKTSEESES